jgi:pimeloyl-ACP methyl ester carboxylesterase
MKSAPAFWPILALLASLTLSSCARYATVAERRPQFHPIRTAVGAMLSVEKDLIDVPKRSQREPMPTLARCLVAARTAQAELDRNPNDEDARRAYNYALSRVFMIIRDAKLDPWTKPLEVPTADGSLVLTNRPDSRAKWNPALYDFTPSDQFDVGGVFVKEHVTKDGLGAPLVAIGKHNNEDEHENFYLPRTYYGVTAVVRFQGNKCEVAFSDPLATETVHVGKHTYPLAADFSTPVAVLLASTKPEKMGLARLINPEKYADTARIARLQPYDPNKTVVLVIHGLNSSPPTYTPMINALRGDENIRKNYQFWFYSYPSGYPYPHSAAILRKELDAIEKVFPLKKKMVVVGHSMGGCISRLLITDVGDKLWLTTFGKPPEQVDISEDTKKLFTDALIFEHRPEVGRVIFICAPLKGADLAKGPIGRIGASLVKAPVTLLKAGKEAVTLVVRDDDAMPLKRIPNSVDTLAPNNGFVMAINKFPLTPGIPYNTIMGDRGKGGNKDNTKPVQSDGIVPYWSSHMEGAQSELVVPTHHGAHQHPEAINEVRRILLKHAGAN